MKFRITDSVIQFWKLYYRFCITVTETVIQKMWIVDIQGHRIFPPYRCNNCRWPVCNEKCQNGVTHQRECPILASHPHNNETEKQCGIYLLFIKELIEKYLFRGFDQKYYINTYKIPILSTVIGIFFYFYFFLVDWDLAQVMWHTLLLQG